jgi:hypothetical protein
VVRGGSWLDPSELVRTRARTSADPTRGSAAIGFRCAYATPPQDGALRGAPADADDVDREPTDHPLASATPLPEVIVDQLVRPTALVRLGDDLFALDAGAGDVIAIAQDGSTSEIASGLVEPIEMASDGDALIVTDRGAANVVRITVDGEVVELAAGQDGVGPLAVAGGEIWFGAAAGVSRIGEAGTIEVLATVAGITSLALSTTHVYWGSDGGAAPEAAAVGRLPRAGGTPEVLVDGDADVFYATFGVDIAWDEADDALWILRKRRSGMPTTVLCSLPGGTGPLACPFHGLIHGTGLTVSGPSVRFSGMAVVVTLDPAVDATYRVVGPWTSGAPNVLAHAGDLWWADPTAGRVLRAPG